jgi:hypothetical protein
MIRFLRSHFALVFLLFASITAQTQTIKINTSPTQSGSILIGTNTYHVSENIYTEAEIGASNFTTVGTALNHIDFNIFTVGTNTTINSFRLYLKEVPTSTTSFTTGIYNTTGYTEVFNGSFTANTTGWVGVDLTTPFVRTAGNNLQLLIERMDGTLHSGFSINASRGNSTDETILSTRRLNTATLPVPGTTNLNTASAVRPQVRLRHINANDAAVETVYTLGKLPIPFTVPHTIAANVVNNGSTTLDVALDITGANSFSDIQTIASLAPGAAVNVSFNSFNPTVTGNNTITVSVPDDDYNTDNDYVVEQEVSTNAYSYAYSTTPFGSVGFTGNSCDFVARFTTNAATTVNQVGVYFRQGGQPFKIGIWDKSATGVPGSLLWESASQTSVTGVFTLPILPGIPVSDTFFIGVRQTGTVNIQFAYQLEAPIRPSTFFLASPSGSTGWTDFAPGNPFRFMIEPRLTITNDVGVSFINDPLNGSSIDNCGIVPKATVVNFGSNDQSSPFDVTYQIKQAGTTVYSSTKAISLLSGQSDTVQFDLFNGSVSGIDSSFVFTSLATDGARNNDTLVNSFTTANYSYALPTAGSGNYEFANSTSCATPSAIKPVYNWITETSNEINWGSNGNDSILSTPITLPFTFNYFNTDYTQLWLCSNGWVSFTNPAGISAAVSHTPVSIPLAGGLDNYIAALLTNLDVTNATYADAHTYYGGDATQLVITFKNAHLFGSASDFVTFQLILKPNGEILIQYNADESSTPLPGSIINNASAGIENAGGTQGILYRLNQNRGPLFDDGSLAVLYKPASATPVILQQFDAQRKLNVNQLTWATSQEINSKHFVIERSTNGRNFTALGTVKASGNSNRLVKYTYTDNQPTRGINFYRLQLVDADNNYRFSDIKSVRNLGKADVSIYPNPVRDNVKLIINTEEAEIASLVIYSAEGKAVYTKTISLIQGINTQHLALGHLAGGAYILKLQLKGDTILQNIHKVQQP